MTAGGPQLTDREKERTREREKEKRRILKTSNVVFASNLESR